MRVSIAPNFIDSWTGHQCVFDFFRSNVFPLGKFEEIFSSVNKFQASVRLDNPDIPSDHKTIMSKSFLGSFFVFEIGSHVTVGFDEHFSSGH